MLGSGDDVGCTRKLSHRADACGWMQDLLRIDSVFGEVAVASGISDRRHPTQSVRTVKPSRHRP